MAKIKLAQQTKEELREIASAADIPVYQSLTKDQLILLIDAKHESMRNALSHKG